MEGFVYLDQIQTTFICNHLLTCNVYMYIFVIESSTKSTTMTTLVFKSDFKDFPGLQKACKYFQSSIISRSANYISFDGVNPYEKAHAWDVNYNSYAKAIEFAMQNDFSLFTVRGMMDTLKMDGEELLSVMLSKVCWPKGHINRTL